MGKKLAVLFLTLTLLSGFSGWYIATGIRAYFRYQQNNQEHCGGQSPVHICVQAPPGIFSAYYPYYVATHANLFTINYSSSSPITLIVSVNVAGFSQVETHTVNATASVQSISFTPPLLNSQALRKLTFDENTPLHVSVTDAARHIYYVNDSPLLLHSRWVMQWIATNRLQIAAWVTPNDPAVITLVSRAATHFQLEPAPIPRAMIGYDNGRASPRAVRDQVDAIFDAMRLDYHIRYSQESVPYNGTGDTSALENIKLPAEVLQLRSGMCIELTALLASAVERIGLDAEIVIIPGHAFLGVAVTQNDTQFEYWDAVQVNDNVAGDSANLWTDDEYRQNAKQIVDTILISAARKAYVGPML